MSVVKVDEETEFEKLFNQYGWFTPTWSEVKCMGKIKVVVTVTNTGDLSAAQSGFIAPDAVRKSEIEFLVDTGAAMVCLPLAMIERLGLRRQSERKVQTANGAVSRGIYSPVQITILGRDADLNVMELPDDGTPALLGYLALEALDLYPNVKAHRLEGNPKNGGEFIMDLF